MTTTFDVEQRNVNVRIENISKEVVLVSFKARYQVCFGGTGVTTMKLVMGDNTGICNETTELLTESNCANNYTMTSGEV